jgi:hypothetical protein
LTPTPLILAFEPQFPNHAGLSSPDSVELKPDFRFEDGRLIVKGAIVDTISEFIADTFVDKRTLEDKGNDLYTWTRRALAAVRKSALFNISTPKSLEKWARTMSSNVSAHVSAEKSWGHTRYVKLYELFLKAHVNNPKVQGLDHLDARGVINEDNDFSEEEREHADYYYRMIALSLQWKRIAVTERGDLAIVQQRSKLGDKVCNLPSSTMPLLIRQVQDTESGHNRYQLVGESYVDGLMFGEGLSIASLQEIVLV